jgi:hypothetical protein
METDLTTFQRNFREARAAADRGETVMVKSAGGDYVFSRISKKPERPFADLEPFFGAVHLQRDRDLSTHETVRRRLKTRRPD